MNMFYINLLFNYLNNVVCSPYFLMPLFGFSLVLKSWFLVVLTKKKIISHPRYPALFLAGALLCLIINDLDWIFGVFIKTHFLGNLDASIFIFLRRIAWACLVFQYQFLSFFLESLGKSQFKLRARHLATTIISVGFFSFFLVMSILNIDCIRPSEKPEIEFLVEKIEFVYALILFAISFCAVAKLLYKKELPRLLIKQLKFILFVMIPYWLTDFLSLLDFDLYWPGFSNTHSILMSINTAILTFAGFYCARKIIGLRFLNFKSHVVTPVRLDFVDHFKIILQQFSHVTHIRELKHITQRFFKDAFNVPIARCSFYIRTGGHEETSEEPRQNVGKVVEQFLGMHQEGVDEFMRTHKMMIYDEMDFNNFYDPLPVAQSILEFLNYINADIFLPIYQKEKLIGYIIIDRFARGQDFYSQAEHDEMLVFASYVANIINLLQNKDIDVLMHQEKQLQEELYRKHQEVNQYKESIRSFLRSTKERTIGVIFYKNRQFIFANQASKELIGFNPNLREGHALTRALRSVVHHVEAYKSTQTVYVKDHQGETLVISGVPNLEAHNIIIMLYYPEVADLIKNQIDMLKDPSEWDYLLYLQTTGPGKLINQLIPGTGEQILQFKIELLKVALGKKATLLNLPEEDLLPVIELIHAISLRQTLQVIDLVAPVSEYDIGIKLFGVDALFDPKASHEPLLKKLDDVGTLFIKNIHFLDLESQRYLAEFIRYGYFKMFKSDKKIMSNVRVVCSTSCDLASLVREGKFAKALFDELKNTTLSMPSLMMLSEREIGLLADGFSEQAAGAQEFKEFLSLSEKDKRVIIKARPASLKELKQKVQELLTAKSNSNQVFTLVSEHPLATDDPELLEISRLGKHVLKDRHLFTQLWHKVQNQNKIATLLGVNRSSVNRRCKAYNLH